MATAMSISSTAPTPMPSSAASGWLALLQEPDEVLKGHALDELLKCVDTAWHQVAEALPDLEALAEDSQFPKSKAAAAVASRVFFHLNEPSQALRLALEAGPQYFDPSQNTPYVERLVNAALDAYIQARQALEEEEEEDVKPQSELPLDQLQEMVFRMMTSTCASGNYQQALGIALEARETSKLSDILGLAQSKGADVLEEALRYALKAIPKVTSHKFRQEALQVVASVLKEQFFTQSQTSAAVDLTHVLQLLKDASGVADVYLKLFGASEQDALLGLQLCFDLVDSGDQAFSKSVAVELETKCEADNVYWLQAKRVLIEGFSSELALSFLHKNSQADPLIMESLKKALEQRGSSRNSMLHNAAVVSHSYLHAGTTNDSFLRNNLEWMKKASNWAKFTATASLGVIHAGHTTEAMTLLEPYLPTNPNAEGDDAHVVSPEGGFSEGGSLYALGLIHGSHAGSSVEKRKEACEFLRNHLRASHANEVISHGAALGVGLTAFGSADLLIVHELKELLYTDSAVAGEAAGMAIGMVLVGSGAGNTINSLPPNTKEEFNEVVSELKNYARETKHEKIIRGVAMGLALINFGQEEGADALIEEMRADRDPIMRYGAMYALALAYCGTSSNKAIRILLHTAVSDVSDDVRMAAVIGIAFVLYKNPERVPELVKLLLESFNPHVRYASCMAVGIAMASTGNGEAVALLEPMLTDMTDYVRQGALLGTAMIYMQQSDTANNRKIKSFRERLSSILGDKHQTTLTKMGSILSSGILDAGGRNCTLNLGVDHTKMNSAVGLCLWLQHWHWYPMMHMMSLALEPTLTIGLNVDFKYPKSFEILCNSKPSVYAYPKRLEEKKEEKKKRVETVTLSTTAKNKARLARKKALEGGDAMDVVVEEKEETKEEEKPKEEESKDDAMEVEESKKKKREPEPKSFKLSNPSRITKAQSAVCEFIQDQRYQPILANRKPFGVLIVHSNSPQAEDELEEITTPSLEADEAPPPEPFEWTPPPTVEGGDAPSADQGTDDMQTDDTTTDKKEQDGKPEEEGKPDESNPAEEEANTNE